MAQFGEQVLVEAFVTQPSIEALDEAGLYRFSCSGGAPFETAFLQPFEDGVRGKLRAVVADHHAGMPSEGKDQHSCPDLTALEVSRIARGDLALDMDADCTGYHRFTSRPGPAIQRGAPKVPRDFRRYVTHPKNTYVVDEIQLCGMRMAWVIPSARGLLPRDAKLSAHIIVNCTH